MEVRIAKERPPSRKAHTTPTPAPAFSLQPDSGYNRNSSNRPFSSTPHGSSSFPPSGGQPSSHRQRSFHKPQSSARIVIDYDDDVILTGEHASPGGTLASCFQILRQQPCTDVLAGTDTMRNSGGPFGRHGGRRRPELSNGRPNAPSLPLPLLTLRCASPLRSDGPNHCGRVERWQQCSSQCCRNNLHY